MEWPPSEERIDELERWDTGYRGEEMRLTRAELVELLLWDGDGAENGNYHSDAEQLRGLADLVEALPAETPFGFFAWHVGELGSIRRCLVRG